MGLFDPWFEQARSLKRLAPARLRALGDERLDELVAKEAVRARARVEALQRAYPSAGARELCQRLVDAKKGLASAVGGVTGVFGAVTVPLDLVGMLYLQLVLVTEVATVFKVPLRSARERAELVDLLGYANGIGPVQRAGPRVLGALAATLLARGGLKTLSRAVPVVAVPVSAYLNGRHVQKVGDAAVRHYDGWSRAHDKARRGTSG